MRIDLLLDDNDDLLIQNNDLVIGASDEQHVIAVTNSEKGDWKESPFIGFGLIRRLKQRFNKTNFIRDLTVELANDGYDNPTINIDPSTNTFNVEV